MLGTIARRYPDVRYFQMWNEMKGIKLAFFGSSDPDVETLATPTHLLLINKRRGTINIARAGTIIPLAPYEVRLLPVS